MLGFSPFDIHGVMFYAVEIKTPVFWGFSVFNNPADAIKYIAEETQNLHKLGFSISPDPDYRIPQGMKQAYGQAVGLFTDLNNKQLYLTGF